MYEICVKKQNHHECVTKRQSAPAALALHKSGSGSPPLLHSSLSGTPRGVQRRADGTIIECDGPGKMYSAERRNQQSNAAHSRFNTMHLNVTNVDSWINEDCQVDQENSFNNDNYQFSRQAPERRIVRISPRLHAKRQKNSAIIRKTSLPASPSFEHHMHQENKRCMSMPSSYGMSRSRQISESVPSLVSGIHKMFSETLHEMQRERLTASA